MRNFIEGTYLHTRTDLPLHVAEQVKYRMSLCPDCLKAQKCHSCSCKVPELFYAPHKTDAGKKWGPMLNPDQWEAFKQKNGLSFSSSADTHKPDLGLQGGLNLTDNSGLSESSISTSKDS